MRPEKTGFGIASAFGCVAIVWVGLICLLGRSVEVKGIILHPAGEPNLATWQDRPSTEVIARWSYNASCVVVSPNCIVTTRHQGGGTGSVVVVGGVSYTIDRIWNHPEADLRVVRLNGAAFNDFVDLYDTSQEVGRNLVIYGYGRTRDSELTNLGTTYGYTWAQQGNTVLGMGTNRVNSTATDDPASTYVSELLTADFDGLGSGFATQYECAIASYDSGGGWFIKQSGQWKLAGLSRGVEPHYEVDHEDDSDYLLEESWFRNREQPELPDPDYLDAIRISPYADWIRLALVSPMPGDLNEDLQVDFADLAILCSYWGSSDCVEPDFCEGADFEPDGDVDFDDLAWFAAHWLTPDLD